MPITVIPGCNNGNHPGVVKEMMPFRNTTLSRRRLAALLLLTSIGILCWNLFVPATYDVPAFRPRAGTQSWHLSTGSVIGYTHVPARGAKRPFPIIFLQGGPGGIIYDRTIALLAPLADAGYDLYFYDQIGSGHSARLADIREYTPDRHARDLEAIVRAIGAEKVILIGQSWGAMLAMLYLADHPGSVERLVLTGPGPVLPVQQELADVPAPDSLALRKPMSTNREGTLAVRTLRSRFMGWWATTFGQKLASDTEADAYMTQLTGALNKSTVCDTANAAPATGGSGFYAHLMTVHHFSQVTDTRDRFRTMPLPVLVMKGACDNQPWGFTAEYLTLFPRARLAVIPGAGHSIGVEQPEQYFETIRAFLGGD